MSYYVDLTDFSLYNWDKCQSGDLRFVRMNLEIGTDEQDAKAWELLQYDYMERFGISAKHIRFSTLHRDLLILKLENCIENSPFIEDEIDNIKTELEQLFQSSSFEKNTIDKSLIHMNKAFNCGLDKTKITVVQYFLMIEEYGKKN